MNLQILPSTGEPLADGNASQSNPRLPVEFLSRNGKIKAFIGAVALFGFKGCVCVAVDEHHSFWKHQFNDEPFQEKLWLGEILFKDIGSREFFKPWTGERLQNFISAKPAAEIENQKQDNNEENNMAKKTGKIALAKSLLKSGKTPAQVAARLVQSFKVSPDTAKNTTAWCKSMLKKETAAE